MPDPVTLYVQCLPTRPEAFGTWFCEASPAEVLAHPAVVALTAELSDARMAVNVEPGETVGHAIRALAAEGQSHLDAYAEEAVKCARLQAVLDAERGERGPEGWEWFSGEWERGLPVTASVLRVDAPGTDAFNAEFEPIFWSARLTVDVDPLAGGKGEEEIGVFPTALEAMEAADRAAADRASDAGGEGTT